MRRYLTASFLVFLFFSSLFAAHKPEQYQTGKIVEVQQKTNSEVLYYLVNTPVTRDTPYFEVSIQVKDFLYRAQYTPRHSADGLPEDWKPEAEVQVRLNKHELFVKRPEGGEIQFAIEKRSPAIVASAPNSSTN
ncbi:MAG: hypothetical protein M3O09_00450 [Acidobacteriota bacterium]|jgi:hypothetical protein|nr:hypothetical protein [Acidobacteriota bacterium]